MPGTGFGPWSVTFAGCVDVTDLNPAPTPDEVFRYFRTLPLPHLTTHQQPPGNALVNLPVIFYTDNPTTQTFTLANSGRKATGRLRVRLSAPAVVAAAATTAHSSPAA